MSTRLLTLTEHSLNLTRPHAIVDLIEKDSIFSTYEFKFSPAFIKKGERKSNGKYKHVCYPNAIFQFRKTGYLYFKNAKGQSCRLTKHLVLFNTAFPFSDYSWPFNRNPLSYADEIDVMVFGFLKPLACKDHVIFMPDRFLVSKFISEWESIAESVVHSRVQRRMGEIATLYSSRKLYNPFASMSLVRSWLIESFGLPSKTREEMYLQSDFTYMIKNIENNVMAETK